MTLKRCVLQCCCSVLQCNAGCCSVLQGVAGCCGVLHHARTRTEHHDMTNMLFFDIDEDSEEVCVAECCSVLQCAARTRKEDQDKPHYIASMHHLPILLCLHLLWGGYS